MRPYIKILLTLFIPLISFSQENPDKLTPLELTKANGSVSVESQYPVDTNLFELSYVYLNNDFQVAKEKKILNHKYRILQNTIYGNKIAKLPRKKPIKVHLDSVFVDTIVKAFFESNNPQTYTTIINGHLIYKKLGKILDYKIDNGKVSRLTVSDKKSDRILYFHDFSGLYSKTDRTWPVAVGYRKDGTIRGKVTILYHEHYYYEIPWQKE